MLGMRLSSSRDSAKEEERSQEEKLRGLVKNLLFHHQDVQKKLKDCKSALTMALTCFESMRNVRRLFFQNLNWGLLFVQWHVVDKL